MQHNWYPLLHARWNVKTATAQSCVWYTASLSLLHFFFLFACWWHICSTACNTHLLFLPFLITCTEWIFFFVCRRVVTDNLCNILTYASFLHFLCTFFAFSLHSVLVGSWSIVSPYLCMCWMIQSGCEWLVCWTGVCQNQNWSESGWAMSGLPILRVTSLLTSFFFFFYLVAAYLPSRLISNEASRWIVSHKASICWV